MNSAPLARRVRAVFQGECPLPVVFDHRGIPKQVSHNPVSLTSQERSTLPWKVTSTTPTKLLSRTRRMHRFCLSVRLGHHLRLATWNCQGLDPAKPSARSKLFSRPTDADATTEMGRYLFERPFAARVHRVLWIGGIRSRRVRTLRFSSLSPAG